MPGNPRRKNASDASSTDLAARVGLRIRRLRGAKNVSLSRLARDSGLAKGTLSELENGYRNPTLDTLFAITTALGTPLSSLLSDPSGAPLGGEVVDGVGVRATLLFRYDAAAERVELYLITVSTTKQESAPHHTGVTETMVVLEGTIMAGNTGELRALEPGDTFTYRGDLPHVYRSVDGDAVAVLFMRYPILTEGEAHEGAARAETAAEPASRP